MRPPTTGATADITLNGFRKDDNPKVYLGTASVLDLSFTGTSNLPFPYSESSVVWMYARSPDPFDTGNENPVGPRGGTDYRPYMPPAPLRVGAVSDGQTVHGLVILEVRSPHQQVVVQVDDPDPDVSAHEAAWLISM